MVWVEFGPRVSGFVRPALETDALDLERVAFAAHYIIAKSDPSKLGHVKLNKILWYSDIAHYRRHGTSMTGLRQYTRTPQGPMSQDISKAVRRLVKEGKVAERTVKIDNFPRLEMISLEQPDALSLTDKQSGILDQIIEVIAPLTAKQLSEMSYSDPLWQEIQDGQAMSIATGSIISRSPKSTQPPSTLHDAASARVTVSQHRPGGR